MITIQEFQTKRGRRITKPKRKQATYMIDSDLPDTLSVALVELSVQEKRPDLSISDIVNDAINYYMISRGIKKI